VHGKRKCVKQTKAGKRCQAFALKGKDVCLAHDEKTRQMAGFGGAQPNAGRPPSPRPSEIARRLIEENILVLQKPYWNSLGYDVKLGPNGPYLVEKEDGGAKIYGVSAKNGAVYISEHDDLEAMQKAAERLQDRVYGKPKQTTELSGPDGGPVELTPPDDAVERSRRMLSLLPQHELEALVKGKGNGNGNGNGSEPE
jgi:hypothetical protein